MEKWKKHCMDAALGLDYCDLTVENARLVNLFTGEIYQASVDVRDGMVVRVRSASEKAPVAAREIYDAEGRYLLPGLIDTHMHVESTMMIPENLSRAVVPLGTTTICTDPHEIANVMGTKGVDFMLESSRRSSLRQYILAPSSVPPAYNLEHSGAVFTEHEIGKLLELPEVIGIAELMNYNSILAGDSLIHRIIVEGEKRGGYLQGHAPGVSGAELAAYRIAGPLSDHESVTGAEALEKLRAGMHLNLRPDIYSGSITDMMQGLLGSRYLDQVSLCTDDMNAEEILDRGNINHIIAQLIEEGVDSILAYRMGTLHAARSYGFQRLGAVAPGYWADLQLLDQLDGGIPDAVFIEGTLVARRGKYIERDEAAALTDVPNTIRLNPDFSPDDCRLPCQGQGKCQKVWILTPESPGSIINIPELVELPVRDGCIDISENPELQFLAVVNRYGENHGTVAVYRGFSLFSGAFATTVSHDTHNLTMVYRSPEDAYIAAQEIARMGGGMCVVKNGLVLGRLPLLVGGLMSLQPCDVVAAEIGVFRNCLMEICDNPVALAHSSVMSLTCLPGLVVTDLGVVDGNSQTFFDIMQAE